MHGIFKEKKASYLLFEFTREFTFSWLVKANAFIMVSSQKEILKVVISD